MFSRWDKNTIRPGKAVCCSHFTRLAATLGVIVITAMALLSGCKAEPIAEPKAEQTPARSKRTRIYSYRSPDGGTEAAIIRQIDSAKRRILVAMYYLTDEDLAQALIRAKRRGVDVKVVVDKSQVRSKNSQISELASADIPVHIDKEHKIMHNKFCVVDGSTVITGSQNWTVAADTKNSENTLIIKNNDYLATKYAKWFESLTLEAIKYAPKCNAPPPSLPQGKKKD